MKKVYVAMAGHPNMNYDRSPKSVIWDKFPKIYMLFMRYLQEHPDIKVHLQLPSQTLNSLKQCGPEVLDAAAELHQKGRIRYMGTYYSEPVGMCMDGMSVLDSAELGCRIARKECGELEGFFLQEIAYFPQVPYIINRLDLQWVLLNDCDGEHFSPYWIEGLDGSRCVGVPCVGGGRLIELAATPDLIPNDALLLIMSDLEIPVSVKRGQDFKEALSAQGIECEWTFVSDYLKEHAPTRTKRPGPCTNKPEGTEASPSCSRWVSKPLDIVVHAKTLEAMEAYRRAAIIALSSDRAVSDINYPEGYEERAYTTWDCDQPADYPRVEKEYLSRDGRIHPLSRVKHLIAWATNSDARGWFPWYERRVERMESFAEAAKLADMYTRAALAPPGPSGKPGAGTGFIALNPYPAQRCLQSIVMSQPLDLLTPAGENVVKSIRRTAGGWEHLCAFDFQDYEYTPLTKKPSAAPPYRAKKAGNRITRDAFTLREENGKISISAGSREMHVSLMPFRIAVQHLEKQLREPKPEGDFRTWVVDAEYPSLIVERQLDYHVYFHSEYVLGEECVFCVWKFFFTAPTLVESADDEDTTKTDFTPGGIKARVDTDVPGDVYYDIPLGTVKHGNREESFVTALTHAFVADSNKGVLVCSQSGVQSFQVDASAGSIALCMGRSNTSGGRRKMSFKVGGDVTEVEADRDWYREPFSGEYVHRFAIHPFEGAWRDLAVPVKGRALSCGIQLVESVSLPGRGGRMMSLTPENVLVVGSKPDESKVILNEVCGKASHYHLVVNGTECEGEIAAFQVIEVPVGS